MRLSFKKLEYPELVRIEPRVFDDQRGFIMETYHQRDFEEAGIPEVFAQDNHSRSKKRCFEGCITKKIRWLRESL